MSRASRASIEAEGAALLAADQAWLAGACLGQGLPAEAERHLRLAGLAYQQDEAAERHLRAARAAAPEHPAVQIGLYRFYFYKGRLAEALAVANRCLGETAASLNLAPDWRAVRRQDADFGNLEAIPARFYLFTLKACAYLQMRLGKLEESDAALKKMLELDPSDKLNATVLLQVLARHGQEDEDE